MIEKYLEGHKCKIVSEDKINELRQVVIKEYLVEYCYVLNEIDGKVYTEDWKLVYDENGEII